MIFNMVGGGGGGLKDTDAVLIVTVPTGSTVTATKNGMTLTPTIWVQNADNTLDSAIFSIPSSTFDANAWTVTATLGGASASDTVLIDTNKEYNLELSYSIYLYNNGDLCTDVTGGWSYAAFLSGSDYSAGTLNTAYNGTTCYLSASGSTKQISAVTVNKIDVTNYRTLQIVVSDYTFAGAGYHHLCLVSSRGNASSYAARVEINSTGTFAIDVSSITSSYYIGLYLNSGTAGSCAIGFKEMYLVK